MNVRAAAVAGTFYPANPRALADTVDALLAHAEVGSPPPKAIVVPHAGYRYSGPVAATAYARLAPLRNVVSRVVLLGPAHRVPLRRLAVPSVDAFRTPLGDVKIDGAMRDLVLARPNVGIDDDAHRGEHSLEVHLPFLQRVLDEFTLLPLAVGIADEESVARVLDDVWNGEQTLVVVSSDLSHYEPHESALRHDRATADAILAGQTDAIDGRDACGAHPIRGLLLAVRRHRLQSEVLDLRTSADTAGEPDRVVGYGAFAWTAAS